MSRETTAPVSAVRVFLRDFPLGYLMAPLAFSWIGAVAMGSGFSFGRAGRAHGPELFPAILGMAVFFAAVVLLGWVVRFLRFKSILASGVPVQATIGPQGSTSGLATIEYSYDYNGESYEKSHSLPSLFCPGALESTESVVIVDSENPDRSFLRDLYCSPVSNTGDAV